MFKVTRRPQPLAGRTRLHSSTFGEPNDQGSLKQRGRALAVRIAKLSQCLRALKYSCSHALVVVPQNGSVILERAFIYSEKDRPKDDCLKEFTKSNLRLQDELRSQHHHHLLLFLTQDPWQLCDKILAPTHSFQNLWPATQSDRLTSPTLQCREHRTSMQGQSANVILCIFQYRSQTCSSRIVSVVVVGPANSVR